MRPGCVTMRAAFTLIELLVSIAIIGVLLSLLLPAVQLTREAGRQVRCKNNQRQIGLGLQAYHDVHGSLPIGCLQWRGWGKPATNKHLAWSAFLLPYIEQRTVHRRIDFDYPYDHPLNAEAAAVSIPTYLCPTAQERPGERGRTSYGGLFGERLVDPRSDDGVFLHERPVSFRDCRDGLSNTIAVGEDVIGPHSEWINGGNVFVQSHPINDDTAWIYDNEIRSLHPAGAMVLFLDSHVELLNESIDERVLGSLITRGGGEFVERDEL